MGPTACRRRRAPTAPLWNQPPGGAYPPPPPPAGNQPPAPGYPPPPPGGGRPGGYPAPTSSQPGGYPPPGTYPPAGPAGTAPGGAVPPPGQPAPAGPWGPPPPPGYGPGPVAPPAKRNGRRVGLIIALVVLLLLCPCLGLAGWGIYRAADVADSSAPPASTSPVPVEPSDEPTAAPTTAKPSPSEDDDDFAKGDCVVNDGTDDDAELRKVPCGPGTYEILLRIPATSDGDRCETLAPKSTANYVHDNSVDFLDYVLCLKKR
ncbi:hypothetical protein JD77_02401 [Micromonospora olivasterospora]|uniref:Uncharacterized protein n=1 Tax=Micromonospora olivasterospora TaxID=1880 RepID=A0A562I9B6_MICOL|nr:hypothetical protein [Micromonospora olivasterospora]TWH67426.1 hypothetical protein JD77_02401 [Micromonospora olivasterospora]